MVHSTPEAMIQSTPFIVHVAILLLSTLSCCSTENVYCVKPTDTSCSLCPHNSIRCATLSEYAQQTKSYFTSNTTMVFLPGDHTLDVNITVANISRLTMCGESSSGYVARVVCNGSVGLSFMSVVDFKIHSLVFISCGRNFDKYSLVFDKYVLLLESTEYAVLFNCSFQTNLGTALAVYHTSITLAKNNEFTHNHCDGEGFIPNSCVGGGGITALDSNLTFTGNTTFLRNRANFSSAGIYMINSRLSSTGSIQFINNLLTVPKICIGKYFGVAIWASASFLSITGTTNIINNSYSGGNSSLSECFYGVIYASPNTSLTFTGISNFINNSVRVIFADHTSMNFIGTSYFINNSAALCVGAILAYDTSLSFAGNSNFINNSAYDGGAIYADQNTLLKFTGSSNFINHSEFNYIWWCN